MKIGIDISSIVFGTGVSRYTSNLCRSLVSNFPDQTFLFFGGSLRQNKLLRDFSRQLGKNIDHKFPFLPPKFQSIIFNQLHLPIETFTKRLDIFHSWDWYTPSTSKASLVTTVHDLSAIKYPSDTHPEIVSHHKRSLAWIKKEAKVVIAVSQSTKDDLIEILGFDEGKIEVIYEALPVEQMINPKKDDILPITKSFNITKPYFLIVGSKEPRKNINRMIEAFTPFAKTHQLVIVGKSGHETIAKKDFVTNTGYLKAKDLAALYQGSQGLLYASIYEGFGLPILEAFYHHVPVITSNISSMPEVAGQAAAYCNPLDTSSITKALNECINKKEKLIEQGTNQLKKFTWEKVSKATMEVYKLAYVQK